MILQTPHDGKTIYVNAGLSPSLLSKQKGNQKRGSVSNDMLRHILEITPCDECVVYNLREEIAHLIDYDIVRDYPDVSFRIEDNMLDSVQDAVGVWSRNLPSNAVHINQPFYFLYPTMSLGLDHDCDRGTEKEMFCFVNNRVRPFRKLLWDRLSEDNLLNDYCSFLELGVYSDQNLDRTGWIQHGHEVSNTPPDFYHRVAVDLFVETETDRIRYTEKTWKPLFHRKICFGFGGQHFYRRLKSFGFKLHEDYIDYSFDEISDPKERFDAYYTQVKQLTEFRIDDLLERTVWEREENRNNCFRLIMDADTPSAQEDQMYYNLCKTQAWEMMNLGKILSEEERIQTRDESWYGHS